MKKRNNIFKKRALCLALTLCLIISQVCMPAFAGTVANDKVYLVLGDSISTGYGLADVENEAFANILAEKLNMDTVHNEAVNGNTAAGILKQLQSGDLDKKVKSADLITITAGGNDMMFPLYGLIASAYNEFYKDEDEEPLTGDNMTDFISAGPSLLTLLDLMDSAMLVLKAEDTTGFDSMDSEKLKNVFGDEIKPFTKSDRFNATLNEYEKNLKKVLATLYKMNPNAVIVISTQYNPYEFFRKGENPKDSAIALQDCMQEGAEILNGVIKSVAESAESNRIYVAEEVYTAFHTSKINLSNAKAEGSSVELDFHPNASGHAVIADIMAGMVSDEDFAGGAADDEDDILEVTREKLQSVKLKLKSEIVTSKSTGKKSIRIKWTAPEDVELDGYEVFRSKKKNSGYGKKAYFKTSKTSYKNTAVKKGRTYYYRVRGYVEVDGIRIYTPWSTKAYRKVK